VITHPEDKCYKIPTVADLQNKYAINTVQQAIDVTQNLITAVLFRQGSFSQALTPFPSLDHLD
jgi:hypothetical protein